ncbi:hypothetical protein [Nocardia terpenica]|nr:hypothetical protein [Nocardia terpenica]
MERLIEAIAEDAAWEKWVAANSVRESGKEGCISVVKQGCIS